MVHIELNTTCSVSRANREADRSRTVAGVLVQTVFLIYTTTAVSIAEVEPEAERCQRSFLLYRESGLWDAHGEDTIDVGLARHPIHENPCLAVGHGKEDDQFNYLDDTRE